MPAAFAFRPPQVPSCPISPRTRPPSVYRPRRPDAVDLPQRSRPDHRRRLPPAISADYADLDLLAWVISACHGGDDRIDADLRQARRPHGCRRLMLFAIVVFTAASLLCGLAQSMGQLVLARVLQGIGAGGLDGGEPGDHRRRRPPRERGRYQGYFSGMYAIASVAGPVLGACSPSTCRGAGCSGSTCRSPFSRWPSRGEP
ncbi:MFS transporter [Pseudomonas aeruginosa]